MQTATEKSHYEALIAAIDVMNNAPEDQDMSSAFPRQIEHLPLNKNRGSVCGHKKGENIYFLAVQNSSIGELVTHSLHYAAIH